MLLKKNILRIYLSIILFFAQLQSSAQNFWHEEYSLKNLAHDIPRLLSLFSLSEAEMEDCVNIWIKQCEKTIQEIIEIPDLQRNYHNTVLPFDRIKSTSNAKIGAQLFSVIAITHTEKNIRNAALNAKILLESFLDNHIDNNKSLYQALKSYANLNYMNEQLLEEQAYFIQKEIERFERNGMNLSEIDFQRLQKVNAKCIRLAAEFERNIIETPCFILATEKNLEGMSKKFIASLAKNEDGLLIIPAEPSILTEIFCFCTISETRKRLWTTFVNRAYPQNELVLKKLLAARAKKAKLCGFKDFASYDLSNQTVKCVGVADEFLDGIAAQLTKKFAGNIQLFVQNRPESIQLSPEGLLYPWDYAFVRERYLELTGKKISFPSKYFPFDLVMRAISEIYGTFFSVRFELVKDIITYAPDVFSVRVYTKDTNEFLGTLLLDLFPRKGKYHHAACWRIIPGIQSKAESLASVTFVLANIHTSANQNSILLTSRELITLFHEFGHAMHTLFARTEIGSYAGPQTAIDFIEIPSMMFELWLTDKEIIKKLSHHHVHGGQISDELIEKLLETNTIYTWYGLSHDIYLSKVALAYYDSNPHKNLQTTMKDLYTRYFPGIYIDENYHYYARFAHLQGYAAKYYSYVWSKVIAHDLFEYIKTDGLLNENIGKKFRDTVLRHGGGKDPKQLLYDFLGREPNTQAFLEDMELI